MFESDYIMRQIEAMSRVLGEMLFQKDSQSGEIEILDEQGTISGGNLLLYRLKKMILDKRVNEAENILFDTIEQDPDEEYLKTAVAFYDELRGLSDEELAACDFSREEIYEGMKQIREIYSRNHR